MPSFTSFAFPVWILLVLYSGFLLFYLIYSIFSVYHLVKFGVYGSGLYVLVTLFVGGSLLLVGGSVLLLAGVEWSSVVHPANWFNLTSTSGIPLILP